MAVLTGIGFTMSLFIGTSPSRSPNTTPPYGSAC
jgi:Na+/H+ antiporter NhaA